MGEEKRLYSRFEFRRPAQCAYLDSFPETFDVTVIDISPEGIGFESDEPLQAGTTVYFIMDLDGSDSVKFLVKIRWTKNLANSQKYLVGAKIDDTNNKDLNKFIKVYYNQMVPRSERKKKVLLIDHDRNAVNTLKEALEKSFCDVFCTYDGESGFTHYLSDQPDVVVVSMVLPKLDGFGVVRNIRKLQADMSTPIVMLVDKKAAANKSVDDKINIQKFMFKPVKVENFTLGILQLLNEADKANQ